MSLKSTKKYRFVKIKFNINEYFKIITAILIFYINKKLKYKLDELLCFDNRNLFIDLHNSIDSHLMW